MTPCIVCRHVSSYQDDNPPKKVWAAWCRSPATREKPSCQKQYDIWRRLILRSYSESSDLDTRRSLAERDDIRFKEPSATALSLPELQVALAMVVYYHRLKLLHRFGQLWTGISCFVREVRGQITAQERSALRKCGTVQCAYFALEAGRVCYYYWMNDILWGEKS